MRRLPLPLGWVALQNGPKDAQVPRNVRVDDYWTGEEGALPNEIPPTGGNPRLFGQQGVFMATREQILFFHDHCRVAFLPPFTTLRDDGLYRMNGEYWSGGQQLWGGGIGACNLQRIVSLRPEDFSRHLLYHTANNKQKIIISDRLVLANTLLGQMNDARKRAEKRAGGTIWS